MQSWRQQEERKFLDKQRKQRYLSNANSREKYFSDFNRSGLYTDRQVCASNSFLDGRKPRGLFVSKHALNRKEGSLTIPEIFNIARTGRYLPVREKYTNQKGGVPNATNCGFIAPKDKENKKCPRRRMEKNGKIAVVSFCYPDAMYETPFYPEVVTAFKKTRLPAMSRNVVSPSHPHVYSLNQHFSALRVGSTTTRSTRSSRGGGRGGGRGGRGGRGNTRSSRVPGRANAANRW